MTKEDKENKLKELLQKYEKGHRVLKHLKEEMRLLRIDISNTKTIVDERFDEINLKRDGKG